MSSKRIDPRPPLRRGFLAGAVVFLSLIGTGTATALWSSQVNLPAFTADGATVGVSQSVGTGLNHTFKSSSLVAAGVVAVTNTGNREAAYSVSVSAASASNLLDLITARVAIVPNATDCTPSATLASPETGTLNSTVTLSSLAGALPAGATVTVCVQTSMSTVASHGGKSLTGSIVSSTSASPQAGWSEATVNTAFSQAVDSTPFVPSPSDWYWIRNAQSHDLCAEVESLTESAVVQQANCGTDSTWTSHTNELWRFESLGKGVYHIVWYHDELSTVRVWWKVARARSGEPLYTESGNNAQPEWQILDHGDGTVSFRTSGPDQCAAIDGTGLDEGVQLVIRNCGVDINQRFVLDPLEIVEE